MASIISSQEARIMTGLQEAEGRLVFSRGALVAVLVRLCGTHYEKADGYWYLEVGFGPCAEKRPDPFKSLGAANLWIGQTVRGSDAFPN